MNVLFNTNLNTACSHIFFDLRKKFLSSGHSVGQNDWSHYEKYDLIFFLGRDARVGEVKKKNPKALVGIMCPWLEKESRMADFLLLDSIEMRETFLSWNKNFFIYFMFHPTPEIPKKHSAKERIIIGYHGNKVHLTCMRDTVCALDRLSEKYNIELWAIYNQKKLGKWRKNVPKRCLVRHIQWTEDVYQKELSKCDIGIAPAKVPINGAFGDITSRFITSFLFKYNWAAYYKSDYLIRFKHPTNPSRLYPFSRLRIPVVAEFVPSYAEMIRDDHSGFLVCGEEGWYHALEKLILDAELRNTMSRNLKMVIDENYSPDQTFKKFMNYINSLQKKHS